MFQIGRPFHMAGQMENYLWADFAKKTAHRHFVRQISLPPARSAYLERTLGPINGMNFRLLLTQSVA
jgi:hypothetical protein